MNEILILITLLALNALAIIGFHYAVQFEYLDHPYLERQAISATRNVLWFIKFYGDLFSPFWRKPLYDCMRCMPSLHGFYIYIPAILLLGLPLWALAFYPIYVLTLSGLMVLIESKFNV